MHRIPPVFVATLLVLASACSSDPSGTSVRSGTLGGTLVMEGGVAPGTAKTRIPGTIELSAQGDRIITIHVPESGTFRTPVPVGKYEVGATTPNIQQVNPGGKHRTEPCTTDQPPFTVTAGKTTSIQVTGFVP